MTAVGGVIMRISSIRTIGGTFLAAGIGLSFGAVMTAAAQTRPAIPDAQIESNVLKALASAPGLATQDIQSAAVFGTVTLTGIVQSDALRTQAENLVARANGVKKVIDEMTIGDPPAAVANDTTTPDPAMQNEAPVDGSPDATQGSERNAQSNTTNTPPQDASAAPPTSEAGGSSHRQIYTQAPPLTGRQRMPESYVASRRGAVIPGGQQAGIEVAIPAGSMLRIRINRGLDSNHVQPGTNFDGTILTDVVTGGAVAIPRGATVSGTVFDAKKAGILKGEGQLSLQLTSVTLGGNVYPLNSEVWTQNGRDKTTGTVNKAVGFGVVGALIGAVAGGGEGAAIGAGLGGGAGLADSAASPRGQIIVPPESVLTFRTATPLTIRTVSEQEMQRLAYAAGPQQPPAPRRVRYYSPYYGYYYGPAR